MIAHNALLGPITTGPRQMVNPAAPSPGARRAVRRLLVGLVVPLLLLTVATLAGARWRSPGIVWGNASTTMQTPLAPPAPNAGKAAWIRFYRSYDPVSTRETLAATSAPAQMTGAIVPPMPQPRALPVDPTLPITTPAPVATPQPIPAEQTR